MSNILRTEIRTENLKCGVCGQTFQCTVKDDYFLNQILVYWCDMDAPWIEAYIFKNLEKLYKDYPGQWFREKAAHIQPYSDRKIYRIFQRGDGCEWTFFRMYSEDPRFFEAIQDLPIVGKWS